MQGFKQLVRFLTDEGFIDHKTLPNPLPPHLHSLHDLGQAGLLDEEQAICFIASKLNLNIIDQQSVASIDGNSLKDVLQKLDHDVLVQKGFLPIAKNSNCIALACLNPLDSEEIKSIEFVLEQRVELVITSQKVMENLFKKLLLNQTGQELPFEYADETADLPEPVEIISTIGKEVSVDKSVDLPLVVRLCNKIIADALTAEASDIHLEPSEKGLEVRFRIHGIMTAVFEVPHKLQAHVITRFKVLAQMDIAERRRPQDGRMRVRSRGNVCDLRVASILTAYGEKMVMRLLDNNPYGKALSSLGMPVETESLISQALLQRGKMLLVTGPTGSGKSTTLYTCLSQLQDGTLNIATVEDPIEYRLTGLNQIQVNEAAKITFASALRSILRQDPDVIMVGEIRDSETAGIALQAAQTGHLVLSTLHTNDAVSAVARLAQLGCPPYLIASSLIGVLAQRLIRTNCPHCARALEGQKLQEAEKQLKQAGLDFDVQQLRTSPGCDKCFNTGCSGRIGLYSYLNMTTTIEELITRGAQQHELLAAARADGHVELHQAAYQLLCENKISFDEFAPYLPLFKENAARRASSVQKAIVTETPAVAPVPTAVKNPTPANNSNLARQKVLLVEDDDGVRAVLSMLLQRDMYDVVEAHNGQEALECVYKESPSIILCDLMMPVMDGRDFLIKLKRNKQTAHIPVIMLTAADDESNEIDLLELGANDFISKASSAAIMLTRIRKTLPG